MALEGFLEIFHSDIKVDTTITGCTPPYMITQLQDSLAEGYPMYMETNENDSQQVKQVDFNNLFLCNTGRYFTMYKLEGSDQQPTFVQSGQDRELTNTGLNINQFKEKFRSAICHEISRPHSKHSHLKECINHVDYMFFCIMKNNKSVIPVSRNRLIQDACQSELERYKTIFIMDKDHLQAMGGQNMADKADKIIVVPRPEKILKVELPLTAETVEFKMNSCGGQRETEVSKLDVVVTMVRVQNEITITAFDYMDKTITQYRYPATISLTPIDHEEKKDDGCKPNCIAPTSDLTVWDLKLHETMEIKDPRYTDGSFVRKVPGGWIYFLGKSLSGTFVPMTPQIFNTGCTLCGHKK